jgi:hypothetical protein
MDSPTSDGSTLVSPRRKPALRLSAVGHTPEIEHDAHAPPQAYVESSEKQLAVYADYPEVVEAPPPEWTEARPRDFLNLDEPKKESVHSNNNINSHGNNNKKSAWGEWPAVAFPAPHEQYQHDQQQQQRYNQPLPPPPPQQQPYEVAAPPGPRRRGRLTGRTFWAILILVVAVIVAVGVGLGLGLGMRHASSNNSASAASATTTAPAIPKATGSSAPPECKAGIHYCGWDLIQSRSTCCPSLVSPLLVLLVMECL